MTRRWILPEGVDEVLPPESGRVEALRRELLDLFHAWGYELVDPPLLEYLDALLVGVGSDLDVQTIKVADQLTGRTLGFRADITSQTTRIDAHSLAGDGPARYCYVGPVFHARPRGLFASRMPLKLGAELYGHGGPESDAEIVTLMGALVEASGIPRSHIELGHTGVFRALVETAGVPEAVRRALFEALQTKAAGDLRALVAEHRLDDALGADLQALADLVGGAEALEEARRRFAAAPEGVRRALEELARLVTEVARHRPDLTLTFDLGELRGYGYHTGMVYTAYADDIGQPVATGGRYDALGAAFGRARQATGFDADLRHLARLGEPARPRSEACVLAPRELLSRPGFREAVGRLRAQGTRVVLQLGDEHPRDAARLAWQDGTFVVLQASTGTA
jgi:ATP phosphoribosyltransferase regulatory subunit